jgi:hypothetical protein
MPADYTWTYWGDAANPMYSENISGAVHHCADRQHRAASRDTHHRWRADRVSPGAGLRSARGDALVLPIDARARYRGECHAHAAQPAAVARQRGDMTVTGRAARLAELMSCFDGLDPAFNIVEPRRSR